MVTDPMHTDASSPRTIVCVLAFESVPIKIFMIQFVPLDYETE